MNMLLENDVGLHVLEICLTSWLSFGFILSV